MAVPYLMFDVEADDCDPLPWTTWKFATPYRLNSCIHIFM